MVSRAFCIPGIIFLAVAFVLSFLVSINLPYLTAFDFARVHFADPVGFESNNVALLKELRLGIWAYCYYDTNGKRTCSPEGHGYTVPILTLNNDGSISTSEIGASWTRGLAVHPVATIVTFIALLLSFSSHVTVTLLSSIVSFLAAFLMLVAFAIDIALYAYTHHEFDKITGVNTNTGPGFWLTFVSLILLLLAGCTVCFGRRRERMSGSSYGNSYPMTTKRRFWPFNRN